MTQFTELPGEARQQREAVDAAPIVPARGASPLRVGIIDNRKSHRNRAHLPIARPDLAEITRATPHSQEELRQVLAQFAQQNLDLIAIDGGDGTVRDVLSAARAPFGEHLPRLAVLPGGKTNALAHDLGVPTDWTVDALLDAAIAGKYRERAPIEITRDDAPPLLGFLFGAGGFVRATELAQRTHRIGAFHGVAVSLSLSWAIAQTLFGSNSNGWRTGERMRFRIGNGAWRDEAMYLLFASTLEKLPAGLRPFGPVRPGLKVLAVDAPPRAVPWNVPLLLAGHRSAAMDAAGYRVDDTDAMEVTLERDFIFDGEHYPGGKLMFRRGAPLRFVVP